MILTLLGLLLAGWFWWRGRSEIDEQRRAVLFGLMLFALVFWALMSLGVKKFDRYLLPALGALLLLAGWGWERAAAWWVALPNRSARLASGGLALVLGLQLLSSLGTAPYYLSYYNPLLGGSARAPNTMMVGWGEGLDQAAAYLNNMVGDESPVVASWYSSQFGSYYTGGPTIDLSNQEAALTADFILKLQEEKGKCKL